MDTLQELLRLLFRLGIALAIVSFIWFLISTIYPEISFGNTVGKLLPQKQATASSTSSMKNRSILDFDWLPAPGSLSITQRKPPVYTATTTNIEKGYYSIETNNRNNSNNSNITSGYYDINARPDMNGSNPYGFIVPPSYSSTTPTTIKVSTTSTTVQPVENRQPTIEETRRLYVRNLSLYEGIKIRKTMTFTGEARDVMYDKNGKFKLIIVDNKSKYGMVGEAIATSDWTIAGWTRFTATIGAQLPNNVPCTLVFESGTINTQTKQPLRFPYRVTCSQ